MEFLKEYPFDTPLIFDSHAHYDDQRFETEAELLKALPLSGVCGVITCGCDTASSKAAISLAEKYDYIYAAAGIHPGNLENSNILEIKNLLSHEKCVAIGEIGLDYYWTQDNKEEQNKIFEEQLKLSLELDKPVIVHDRNAHEDTLNLLKKYRPNGVVHSFSGSVEIACEIIKLGMYIGVGGVITFKNAKKLPDVVKMLPSDRILLETDAPYLTPEPFRGKTNHSAMIYFTAKKIAEIRNISTEEILNTTRENAKKVFDIV